MYDLENNVDVLSDMVELKKQQIENNKKDIIKPFTGEVCIMRSQVAVGAYCDNEINCYPSETDTSDYEDINDTIEKCARSGVLRELEARMAQENNNPTFDDFDETERSDYDISEAKQTLNEIIESATQVSNSSQGEDKQSANEPQTNSSEQADTKND